MADTNFIEINPSATNTENDSAYQSDGFVLDGAVVNSFFDSATANKFFVQVSRMMAAWAKMMVNKGYSPVDGTTPFTANSSFSTAVTNLATVLANIVTLADLIVSAGSGTVQFGPAVGNLTLQWGVVEVSSASPDNLTFAVPLTLGSVKVFLTSEAESSVWVTGKNGTGFTINTSSGSSIQIDWFAIGIAA